MGSIRLALGSLLTALRQVRVWLPAWLLVTLVACLLVRPVWIELVAAYDHQPAATVAMNQHLDADFARERPALAVRSAGAVLFMLVLWTFLGGGILCRVGTGRRWATADFLADCARTLPRNLRALGIGLVLALLLGWGVDSLDGWLRRERLADSDPGAFLMGLRFRLLTLEAGLEMLRWVWGFLFLLLLFASKVARSHLCVSGRRSAALAWLSALASMARHPLRSILVVGALTLVWSGAAFAIGPLLAWADGSGHTLLLLAIGQLLVVLLQVELIAAFLAARAFAGLDPGRFLAAARPESEDLPDRFAKPESPPPAAASDQARFLALRAAP
jgi:hypothetical protein